MITALQVDEFITRGDALNLTMQIKNEDDTPYDLTGSEVELRLYHSWTDSSPVVTLAGQTIDALTGEIYFAFVGDTTKSLPAKAYDLEVVVLTGTEKWTAYHGRFGILPSGGVSNA